MLITTRAPLLELECGENADEDAGGLQCKEKPFAVFNSLKGFADASKQHHCPRPRCDTETDDDWLLAAVQAVKQSPACLPAWARQESNFKALIWVIGEAHGIVAKTADALLNDGGESMRKISLKKEAASC
ncbi:MAG: hypothetical protein ACJ8F4_01015, partial [Sphingomonas sp.]